MSGRLLQLIRLELRLLQRDPGAVLALFILAMAVTYGAANGTSSTEQWSASAGRIVSTERQERVQRIESVRQSTKQGPVLASEAYTDATSPLGAAAKGAAAVLHPTGMSALAVGRTDVRPHAIQISIWRSSTELNKGDFRNPLNMLIGRFDPAFVVVYLLPLFVISVSYGIIADDRERGIWSLIAATGTSTSTTLMLRAGLRFVVTVLVVFLPLIIVLPVGSDMAGFLSAAALTCAYTAFWFACMSLAGVIARSASSVALAGLGCWLAFVLVVPTLLRAVVGASYPPPSRTEELAAARDTSFDWVREGKVMLTRWYDEHPETRPIQSDPVYDRFCAVLMSEIHREPGIVRAQRRRIEALNAQNTLYESLSWLSPATIVQSGMAEAAGTSDRRFLQLQQQSMQFRKTWQERFTTAILQRVRLTASEVESLPQFEFVEDRAGALRAHLWVPAGLLGCIAALLFWLAARTARVIV
jgi:ABC-2 type transport system permease protein